MNSSLIEVNPYWKKFDSVNKTWFILIGVICIIIDNIGIFSNILVLIYLLKKRNRKVANGRYFLINLAIADLLNLFINIPIKAISNLNQKWIFNKTVCQIYGFIGGLFGFVSISTMAFMSIERFLIVKNPLNALKLKKNLILFCSLFTWIYSLIWISAGFLTKRGFDFEGLLTSCTVDYISQDFVSRLGLLLLSVGGFLVPFVIIVICYFLILSNLKNKSNILQYNFGSTNNHQLMPVNYNFKKEKSLLNNIDYKTNSQISLNENQRFILKSLEKSSYAGECREIFELNFNYYVIRKPKPKKNYLLKREMKVSVTVLMCVGFFCISWFPYSIVMLIAQLSPNRELYITPLVASLPALFAKMSTIANPIIYTLHHKDFRIYFIEMLNYQKNKLCSNFIHR